MNTWTDRRPMLCFPWAAGSSSSSSPENVSNPPRQSPAKPEETKPQSFKRSFLSIVFSSSSSSSSSLHVQYLLISPVINTIIQIQFSLNSLWNKSIWNGCVTFNRVEKFVLRSGLFDHSLRNLHRCNWWPSFS